ncbi:hypothetical protein EPR50_G00112380 [Perca flavescens]|uniref:Uncharacterized protein n=1 Tax=Perca flavescens TaxID=8167 RepID=A0A484CYF5_PERFV|nr:hypothetical protein EPR50_G00112380 [Perca flavescens]
MEEEEEEALKNHCRRMISRVLPQPSSSDRGRSTQHGGANGRERRTEFRDLRECNVNLPVPYSTSSPNLICQGPEVQTAPPQLILMLKLKTFNEEMKRAAELELHDPAVCSVCERQQASLALNIFIRRKKTQLQFQTLKGRLNTHWSYGECERWESLGKLSQSLLMPTTGFGRNNLVDVCGSRQPRVALATAKEREVTLATDEMRGYPDKNATGTHLTRPHCAFSDR